MGNAIIKQFLKKAVLTEDSMYEYENFNLDINPQEEYIIFHEKYMENFGNNAFTRKKLAALYLWYLSGDCYDTSIGRQIKQYILSSNSELPYNSNYGKYMFNDGGLAFCIEKLALNKSTRQACIMFNTNNVMRSNNSDKLCTNAVMFRIRDSKLNMSVQMRSNHFINNFALDVFAFCMFYAHIYNELKQYVYKDLKIGTYNHSVASMHIHKYQHCILKQAQKNSYSTRYTLLDFADEDFSQKLEKQLLNWRKSI